MGISDNYLPTKVAGNGVTVAFSGNWNMIASSYARVYWEDTTTGVQTLKSLGTHYTLSFDTSGFTVTFDAAYIPPATVWVICARSISLDQIVPYKTSQGFQGAVQENSFDKITAIAQDLQDQSDRSPKFALGSTALNGVIETPVDGSFLAWDGVLGNIVNVEVADLDLSIDTVFTSLAANDFLSYDGTNWINRTPANSRTALGLVIGTNVQAYDAQLSDVAGLTPTSGVVIAGNGTNFVASQLSTLAPLIASFTDKILYGLSLSTGTDATNDINIAAGSCVSDDGTTLMTLAAITKQLDAAWAVGTAAGGLDTGAVGNNTYHIWAINRPDTNVTDVLFSLSVTAPTMPTNYTKKKRIGTLHRAAGVNQAPFTIGTFVSANQTITAAGALTLPHLLGVKPFLVTVELICTSAEHGYSVGDVVQVNPIDSSGAAGGQGVSIEKNDATNLNIRYGSTATTFILIHKTSGAVVSATNASWSARFRALP